MLRCRLVPQSFLMRKLLVHDPGVVSKIIYVELPINCLSSCSQVSSSARFAISGRTQLYQQVLVEFAHVISSISIHFASFLVPVALGFDRCQLLLGALMLCTESLQLGLHLAYCVRFGHSSASRRTPTCKESDVQCAIWFFFFGGFVRDILVDSPYVPRVCSSRAMLAGSVS